MGRFGALVAISVLLLSTLYSPFVFSSIVLAQEQPTPTPEPTPTPPPEPTPTATPTDATAKEGEGAQPQDVPPTEPQPTQTEPKPTACPVSPKPIACGENQGLITNFDDKGCVTGYSCKEISSSSGAGGKAAACPQVAPPTIKCEANQQLSKTTDDKGCVIGYNCISTAPPASTDAPSSCPASPEKPKCVGGIAPVFDKGCLISYTCVPQGCRQETDASGFVRVVCEQKKVCPAESEQNERVDRCKNEGGNPIPFQDPSGCTFYDCRFDNREIKSNPIGGHQSCPSPEQIHQEATLCKNAGLNPGIKFEGGCKVVKCSQETESVCRFVPDSEKTRIDNECSSRGSPLIRDVDQNGCAFFRCGESVGASTLSCQTHIPEDAYKKCDSVGGEMIVKNDRNGCIAFSQCVAPGDENHVSVNTIEEVPDTTALLSLALKLEKLKIELDKLSAEAGEISKYYASTGSLDEERYSRVSSMFSGAAERINEIKVKIRDSVDNLSQDDLLEIKHDIKYIKEVTLKDILYMMLSNSDDVQETLESSRAVTGKKLSAEEFEQNVKGCGTDGRCFDQAIRSCKPITFLPEGRSGPLITITGLNGDKCVLHVAMQSSNMVPPGFTKDSFYMDCPIQNYALGVRGPEDVIPNCEGPMAKFAKQFGGASQINGGDDEFQKIIETEGGPGGCTSERGCATYCLDNYDECKKWVKDHPAVGPVPSREELRAYASGQGAEFERDGGQSRFAGPGGCNGPQECDRFCRNNPDECLRWCDNNPDMCPQERGPPPQSRGGFGEEPRGFESGQRGFEEGFRQEPISREPSREGVQACVGCLNNGVCDIGECSECGDCLRGARTITGEITRVQ